VANKIRDFVIGGFMFAMCSATEQLWYLAADGIDICEPMFDGGDQVIPFISLRWIR
jgi:hypothetical protein